MRPIACISSFVLFITLLGCHTSSKEQNPDSLQQATHELKYAKVFSIAQEKGYKKITVYNPWDPSEVYALYALVHKGSPMPSGIPEGAILVQTPVDNIVTLSSTHIGLLNLLGLGQKLIGHSDLKYIYHERMREKADKGMLAQVGNVQSLNIETVIDLAPALVMTSGYEKVHDNLKLLEKTEIPVAYNIEWMENSPLGRTEWLKFMAAFFEEEVLADSIFDEIEKEYIKTSQLAKSSLSRPTILAGSQYKGTWYMPGGNSYMAQFLRDANASYHWFSDSTRGSLPLSLEEVVENQLEADIWLNPGRLYSRDEIMGQDQRYAQFTAFQTEEVYNTHGRLNAHGASDYWESGLVNPHLILKDLIKVIHPELLPRHELIYYKKVD